MTEKKKAQEKRTTKPIKDPEILKNIMSVYKRGSRNYLLLAVALNTGLRVSDIIGLKISDINGSELSLIEQKTNKKKTIGLNNDLRVLISDTVEKEEIAPNGFVFFNQRDKTKHISRIQAFRIVNHAGELVGVNISPHSLRKTFGYLHYTRTKDVAQLMFIFNHSSPAVTLRYLGIDNESAFQNVYSHSIGI